MKKLILLIFLPFFSFSQVVKYSNEYLKIGVSARALSLGNSVIATVNDGTAGYYNPAGLINFYAKNELNIMHSEYFAGLSKYDFINWTHSLNDSMAVSASLIRLGIDDIQNTLFLYDSLGNIDYNRIQYFSVADYALFLSVGKKIKNFDLGLTTKLLFRSQGEFAKAYGFGFDVGVKYYYKKFYFGAVARDITTTFTAWFFNLSDSAQQVLLQTGNQLPKNTLEITLPSLKLGAARYFKFSDNQGLLTELDLNMTFDGKRNAVLSFNPISLYPQMGLEWNLKKKLFVRYGMNNLQFVPSFAKDTTLVREKRFAFSPNLGIGIVIGRLYSMSRLMIIIYSQQLLSRLVDYRIQLVHIRR